MPRLTLFALVISLLLLNSSAARADGKSFQFFVNPLGAILGLYNLGAEFAISDRVSIGPEVVIVNSTVSGVFEKTTIKGSGLGLRSHYQFGDRKMIGRGWVASAFAFYVPKYSISQTLDNLPALNNTYTGETSYFVAAATFGYRWLWGFFSLKLAGGVAYNSLPDDIILTRDSGGSSGTSRYDLKGGLLPAGEVMLGFAF
ncbi:MAG TPA: hypothetical protein VFV50_05770 [Bdellovibrionales bacterium]|nr:hypothetical protein [Bdellovibrionales bacterium]